MMSVVRASVFLEDDDVGDFLVRESYCESIGKFCWVGNDSVTIFGSREQLLSLADAIQSYFVRKELLENGRESAYAAQTA